MQNDTGRAGAVLKINLAALRNNYRLLRSKLGAADCGAVGSRPGADRAPPAVPRAGAPCRSAADVPRGSWRGHSGRAAGPIAAVSE